MIIYGINPLSEALDADCLPQVLYHQRGKDNKRVKHLLNQAKGKKVPIETVPDLNGLCGNQAVHQGVAGEFDDNWSLPITKLPIDCRRLVIFDGIHDPHNFGAALRVCEVFGFHHVLYHEGNSSGITPAACKTSSGALFHLRLYVGNLNRSMKLLIKRGFNIYALDADGEATIYDVPLTEPYALVIGAEHKGVRFNIQQRATVVSIPMAGSVNSLNVSCALCAALTEFHRRQLSDR